MSDEEKPAEESEELSDDMAALLNDIQGDPNIQAAQEESAEGEGEELSDDMAALLNDIQGDPNLQAAQTASADAADPNDIQSLLESVQLEGSSKSDPSTQVVDDSANIEFLMDISMPVTFEVGRAKMMIGDLLSLGQGSVIELHRLVGEDLDLFVNGKLVAKGEVVVVNEKFGVRILDIITPQERIRHMGELDS